MGSYPLCMDAHWLMFTDEETLSPLHCADLCCLSGPRGERTISNPQSHPSDVPRRALSRPFGRSQKRVALKFDARHQLLDRQKLSASDAQNNGALPPPPRPPQEGLPQAGGVRISSPRQAKSQARFLHTCKTKSRTCSPRPPRYLRS